MALVEFLRRHDRLGSVLWVFGFATVFVLFALEPDARSVVPNYRLGSANFLAQLPVYNLEWMHGYLYAPAFAVLFAPFQLLGPLVGDGLWRILGFGVLSWAAVRQARAVDAGNWFFILSMGLTLALAVSLGALRNGQSTILLTGACWLATMAALERKPWQTLIWAMVALVAKPVAIIVLLLLGALRPRLVPVLLLAVLVVLALPYAFAPVAYVNELNRDFATLMSGMSLDRVVYFTGADFTAPLAALDLPVPAGVATAIRFVLGLATLGAVLWLDRAGSGRFSGLAIFVLAAFYICLFNPRSESNSYAMLAVPLGLALAFLLIHSRHTLFVWLLCGLLVVAGASGISPAALANVHLWLRPALSIALLSGFVWCVGDWLAQGSSTAAASRDGLAAREPALGKPVAQD